VVLVAGAIGSPTPAAAVTGGVLRAPRWFRAALGIVLAAALWSSPAASYAGDGANRADKPEDALIFGLTPTELAVAAAVGAGAGVAGALVSGNLIAGASLGFGTLGAIYVAHLAAEAVVVGGIYYWWPWDSDPDPPASRTISIRAAGG
jgi:hypothetical protein